MTLSFTTMKLRFFEIWNHAGFQKYLRNTGWLFGERVLRLSVGLFVGVWLARYLGPAQYGLYNYVISFAGLFTVVASLGLDGILVRELIRDEEKTSFLLGTAFYLKLMGGFFSLILLAIVVFVIQNSVYENLLIFIIASSVLFQSFNIIDFYFQSKVLSKYVVLVNVFAFLLGSCIRIFLLVFDFSLIYFVEVLLFESIFTAIGYYFVYKKYVLNHNVWKFDFMLAKSLVKDSWPLIFGAVAATLYMKIDQVMIKSFLSAETVGYYAVAVRLTEIWLFICIILTSSLSPMIIQARKNSFKIYYNRIEALYSVLVKISLVISFSTMLLAPFVIRLLYGDGYLQSIHILYIYIWSLVFVFLSNGSWAYYINEELQKIASLRLIFGAVLNIILNLIMIPYFGLPGAAYSTLISYSFSSYFINFFFKKTRKNFFMQTKAIRNFFLINTWIHPLK